jgi:hypothetical protein
MDVVARATDLRANVPLISPRLSALMWQLKTAPGDVSRRRPGTKRVLVLGEIRNWALPVRTDELSACYWLRMLMLPKLAELSMHSVQARSYVCTSS